MRLVLSMVLLLAAPTLLAATITGKVARVADGDTVTVVADGHRHRVRLAAIDAPERDQRHGKASGDALRALTLNRTVRVEYDKTDRYRRIVGIRVGRMAGLCPGPRRRPGRSDAGQGDQ